MKQIILRDFRQLIPRWHTSRKFAKLLFPKELVGTSEKIAPSGFNITESIEIWDRENNQTNALDLFCRLKQANLLTHPKLTEVINYLNSNKENLNPTINGLVNPSLRFVDPRETYSIERLEIHNIIRKLKSHVNVFPEDPLTWLDLAFYYSILDQLSKASKCASIAHKLQPSHPFVALNYSRFLVHAGEPDEAFYILQNSGLLKDNPLIASAALSINETFDAGKIEKAQLRKLFKNFNGNPLLSSELGASLATIDVKNGALRSAEKLLLGSLRTPTENAIAQYDWLHHKHGINILMPDHPKIRSIESELNNLYIEKDFSGCINKLIEYYSFQPFSEAPLVDAGYLGMVALDNPSLVVQISEDRVPLNEMGFMELNNLLVAKMLLGNKDKLQLYMENLIKKVDKKDKSNLRIFCATSGMYYIKTGKVSEGLALYDTAISAFESLKDQRSISLAKHFLSKAIKDIDKEKSKTLRLEAQEIAKRNNVLEISDSVSVDMEDSMLLTGITDIDKYKIDKMIQSKNVGVLSIEDNRDK